MTTSASRKVTINPAPVLTLWATVLAEHLGFDHAEALTLGRAAVGLNAYTKGVKLGIYESVGDLDLSQLARLVAADAGLGHISDR